MYESFFGLTGLPFLLNPDPSFLFEGKGHTNALAALEQGVAGGARLMVVTGEIGAGKTTLLQAFLGRVDVRSTLTVPISAARLDAEVLSEMLSGALGLPRLPDTVARREALLAWLRSGSRRTLLVIDEAQHLASDAFELLQTMTKAAAGVPSRLQICLVGQPELRILLNGADEAGFLPRIDVDLHLGPLDEAESRQYVEHRLRKAGWSGRPAFDDAAFIEIFAFTSGIPRRINLLCNSLLLSAFFLKDQKIHAAAVTTAAAAMRGDSLHGMPDLWQSGSDSGAPPLPAKVAEEAFAQPTDEGKTASWSCARCSGVNPASATQCWNCLAPRRGLDCVSFRGGSGERSPAALPNFREGPWQHPSAAPVEAEAAADLPPSQEKAPDLAPEQTDPASAGHARADGPTAADETLGSSDAIAQAATGGLAEGGEDSGAQAGRAPAEPTDRSLTAAAPSRPPANRRHVAVLAGAAILAGVLAMVDFALYPRSANVPLSQTELRNIAKGTVTPVAPLSVRDAPGTLTSPASAATPASLPEPSPVPQPQRAAPEVEPGPGTRLGTGDAPNARPASRLSTRTPRSDLQSREPAGAGSQTSAPAAAPDEGPATLDRDRRVSRTLRRQPRAADTLPAEVRPQIRPTPAAACSPNALALGLC